MADIKKWEDRYEEQRAYYGAHSMTEYMLAEIKEWREAAQRTANGDAVAKELPRVLINPETGMPVAEAAAQADDGIEIQQHHVYVCRLNPRAEYAGRPVKPQLLPLVGKLLLLRADWGNADDDPYPGEWAMSRANGASIAGTPWIASGDVEVLGEVDEAEVCEFDAAPTAQPTPQQLEDARGEGWIEGAGIVAKAYLEGMAQPTLPDDDIGRAVSRLRSHAAAASGSVAFDLNAAAYTIEQLHAALRQPGALPDEEYEYKIVGEAQKMPGTGDGFTMGVFKGVDVPSGAVLFIRAAAAKGETK